MGCDVHVLLGAHSNDHTTMSTPRKNVFKGTTNQPLRLALLGAHQAGKSALLSVVANHISLDNYYPTQRNSPMLLQFQPKKESSRAVLDVNATVADLQEMGVIEDTTGAADASADADADADADPATLDVMLSAQLLRQIDKAGIQRLKQTKHGQGQNAQFDESTVAILQQTDNLYDLDYSCPNLFEQDAFSPLSSFHSPTGIASYSRGHSFGKSFTNSAGRRFPAYEVETMSTPNQNHPSHSFHQNRYHAPIATPILVEMVDTPGITSNADGLIPFLERSLDSRLTKDVLSNLANGYNTAFRSRVIPLITGSGISDLNGQMDCYLLVYSAIDSTTLAVVESLYEAIVDAWREWSAYKTGWAKGGEHDALSMSTSIKHLWKQQQLEKGKGEITVQLDRPPIVVVCTHAEKSGSAAGVEQGKILAARWGCAFVKACCAGEAGDWTGAEEAIAVAVRESLGH
jgi:hypothetical protein